MDDEYLLDSIEDIPKKLPVKFEPVKVEKEWGQIGIESEQLYSEPDWSELLTPIQTELYEKSGLPMFKEDVEYFLVEAKKDGKSFEEYLRIAGCIMEEFAEHGFVTSEWSEEQPNPSI